MTPKAFHALFGRIGVWAKMPFRSIRICSATAAAMRSPMPVTTPAHCRLGSATRTSSTRFATPSLRRIGSRTSGANQAEKRDVEKGWEFVELMASGGPTRFADSAWGAGLIPRSEKPLCPLKKLNTSTNPLAARPSGRAGSR